MSSMILAVIAIFLAGIAVGMTTASGIYYGKHYSMSAKKRNQSSKSGKEGGDGS